MAPMMMVMPLLIAMIPIVMLTRHVQVGIACRKALHANWMETVVLENAEEENADNAVLQSL
jgi:hypothetical protein